MGSKRSQIVEKNSYTITNDGYWILNPGHAIGRVVGGHVRCLNALQGTQYWPGLDDTILILESRSRKFRSIESVESWL